MNFLRSGDADAIAYGARYIANSDLVARFKGDAPLSKPDPSTFYGSGPKGHTDYPALSPKDKAA
jgi:N-ethylmaleimide reductase